MFQPCNDNIVISESARSEQTTESGLIISASDSAIVTGIVVARGPGQLFDTGERGKMTVPVDAKVWYAKTHASTISVDGKVFKIVPERYIFGWSL